MVALYVTSLDRAAGKTTICAGLAKNLLEGGRKIGFFRPIITDVAKIPEEETDTDAVFMKQVLSLAEPIEQLCPVIGEQADLEGRIKEAYAKISPAKDVIIVEGVFEQSQTYYKIVEALDAKVIVVESSPDKLSTTRLVDICKGFGGHLLGVVLNKVPGRRLETVCDEMCVRFGEAGIRLLGALPEDRFLLTLTVGELADHLQGEILNSAEKSAELLENFMLGARSVDPGPEYFGRKANKAVILRGERPDMQLAALETSTKGLVLVGDSTPIPAVQHEAEDKGIPIISVKGDMATLLTSIEDALGKVRFHQENKLPGLVELMEQHFDFQAVYQGLGLVAQD